MPENKKWYLLCYDVKDPGRLRRTAKHLEGYGERIQYSIFRCRLSERQLHRLQWELACIITRDDDLLIVGLCKHCAAKVCSKSAPEDWSEKPPSFEII